MASKHKLLPPFSPSNRYVYSLMHVLPILFAAVVSSAQSVIDITLTSNFLKTLHFSDILSYCCSSVMTIPNLFVSFISSREVMIKFISFLRCSVESRYNYFRDKPYVSHIIGLVSLVLGVVSPISGCYITYTTLKEIGLDLSLVWMATGTILIARFCFANFTSRLILSEGYAMLTNRARKEEEVRIHRIFELIKKVDPAYIG